MGSDVILCAEGIRKSYGKKTVLQETSFSVDKGSVVGLFGPNGSGKSTLLNILALAARPDGGRLVINGVDATEDPRAVRGRIGYVPQDIALFGELTVQENLMCWSRGKRSGAKADTERVMESLFLKDLRHKRVSELSGGMKRRVNLAVALLGDPILLILDEPFAGVDFDHVENICAILGALKKNGTTLLISDHSEHRLLPLMDMAMVLRDGRTIFYGTRDEMLSKGSGADGALRAILLGSA